MREELDAHNMLIAEESGEANSDIERGCAGRPVVQKMILVRIIPA